MPNMEGKDSAAGILGRPPVGQSAGLATFSLDGLQSKNSRAADMKIGADLPDADTTIQPSQLQQARFILRQGTLTANRILTLGNTSAVNAEMCQIIVEDTSAFTYTIKDSAGTVLFAKAANQPAKLYMFYWYSVPALWTPYFQWWV